MSALSIPSVVSIRVATMDDLPFMDGLQKKHSKQLGYFPTKQFESYIESGSVLIAEGSMTQGTEARRHVGTEGKTDAHSHFVPSCLNALVPFGYVISKDRYLKRDELGVIYQLCVAPREHRKLIGASLIKEVFARSAYGCKLYCCWCAQDIAANYFWESLGFVPVAFRAGSSGKKRVHIFWQRRINADDETTRYWYPSQTNSGAIREDRLVFPIPPGTHWSEVRAVRLLESDEATKRRSDEGKTKALPNLQSQIHNPKSHANPKSKTISRNGLWFAGGQKSEVRDQKSEEKKLLTPHPRPLTSRERIDPKFVRAARELRDRYLEQVNERPLLLSQGKYDVSRTSARQLQDAPMQFLPAA